MSERMDIVVGFTADQIVGRETIIELENRRRSGAIGTMGANRASGRAAMAADTCASV